MRFPAALACRSFVLGRKSEGRGGSSEFRGINDIVHVGSCNTDPIAKKSCLMSLHVHRLLWRLTHLLSLATHPSRRLVAKLNHWYSFPP